MDKILLLRGLVREKRHWGSFLNILQESLLRTKIITLDLPGMGDQAKEVSPTSIREIVVHIRRRWLENVTGKENWGIFGVSLGGMIALDWASTFENDFQLVVVANSSASNLSPLHHRLLFRSLPALSQTLMSLNSYERERAILNVTSRMLVDKNSQALSWSEFAPDKVSFVTTATRQLLAARGFSAPKNILSPVFFLNSAKDGLVSSKCSEALSRFYRRPLFTHAEAGHDITLDAPDWVASKIKDICKIQL